MENGPGRIESFELLSDPGKRVSHKGAKTQNSSKHSLSLGEKSEIKSGALQITRIVWSIL